MDAPCFIVGTGRCGSTMLSSFLRQHEDVLSLSEFFCFTADLGGRIERAFDASPVDAASCWALLGDAPPKLSTMLRHGVAMPETLWRPGVRTRYAADTGVPALLHTTLPHLAPGDPDASFDAIAEFIASRPAAPMAEHYRELFAWLAAREGKRMWVERSGGSLRLVKRLIDAFPGARFVHLVRDGRACARSMSRHFGFRMALLAMQLTEILGVDPFESSDRTYIGDVPDELAGFLPEAFDADAFRRFATPLPLCGHYWSGEIVAGLRELATLPSDRVLTLRYEDFLVEPEPAIRTLAAFFGPEYVDDAWVRAMATSVKVPNETATGGDALELRALDDACAPGFAALADLYPEHAR